MLNKDTMIHLDLYIKDCTAEFYFNDIPLRKMNADENIHSLNAHHLLLDGENTMEIVIEPGSTPSIARSGDPGESENNEGVSDNAKVCLRLTEYLVGAFAGDDKNGRVLMQLNWEMNKEVEDNIRFPYSRVIKMNLGQMLGPWFWQQCQPVNMARDLTQINRVAEQLYSAFIQGDGQQVARFCEPALRDLGRALPAYGENEFRSDLINDVQTNRELLPKAVPFSELETDFRLCGGGRLVQLINKDWTDTIKSPPDDDGEQYELPVMLGMFQGQWFVAM